MTDSGINCCRCWFDTTLAKICFLQKAPFNRFAGVFKTLIVIPAVLVILKLSYSLREAERRNCRDEKGAIIIVFTAWYDSAPLSPAYCSAVWIVQF